MKNNIHISGASGTYCYFEGNLGLWAHLLFSSASLCYQSEWWMPFFVVATGNNGDDGDEDDYDDYDTDADITNDDEDLQ